MGYAFVKTAIYFSVPHVMTFTNKCHLCKITELCNGLRCQNHRLSCQIYRLLPLILLVTSHNTKDLYCETCYDNKEKKMRYAFVKIAIYFSVPHAMMFTNKCHICKITEFYQDHGCRNHRLSCQIYRLLPPYCLPLAATLWTAIVRLSMIIRTKRKMRFAL